MRRLSPDFPNLVCSGSKEVRSGGLAHLSAITISVWAMAWWQLYEVSADRQARCCAEGQNWDHKDLSGLEGGVESNTVIFNNFSKCKVCPQGAKY